MVGSAHVWMRALALAERDPCAGEQPNQHLAEALQLALAEALQLALVEALLEDPLHERGELCLAFGLPLHDQRLQRPPHGLAQHVPDDLKVHRRVLAVEPPVGHSRSALATAT